MDNHSRAKAVYQDFKDYWRVHQQRMLEELRFSNPACPEQWEHALVKDRGKDRLKLTLDHTNQFILQVVNESRKLHAGIVTMPVDSRSDVDVAKVIDGMFRHIEYQSRAEIAYDTGIDAAARCGLGWMRVVNEVVHQETNEQEIRIKRIADPLSCMISPDFMEPDGQDAREGFIDSTLSKSTFKLRYPKADISSWETDGNWVMEDSVRISEYQYVYEQESSYMRVVDPQGEEMVISEDDYWLLAKQIGYQPQVVGRPYKAKQRRVKWCTLSGSEILEETEFPSQYIGIVPVIGYESWVNGERFLCGMTRRLMDGQIQYNAEESARTEFVAMQPKAPVMIAQRALSGHQEHWDGLATGTPAWVPYNDIDEQGQPVAQPSRMAPPAFPNAFAQGGQIALMNMQAAVGMNKSTLGMPSNAISGRAKLADKEEGDTATFHFTDNKNISIAQVARICLDMIPRIYDTKRQAKMLGVDGKNGEMIIDPKLDQPAQKKGGKVVAINPGIGRYDIRVVAGPSYTTQRDDTSAGIDALLRSAPGLAPALAPIMVKMQNWPDAERVSRMILALAPPEVQKAADEAMGDGDPEIPPQIEAAMKQMTQQMEQMGQMLDAAEKEIARLEQDQTDKQIKAQADAMKAENESKKVGVEVFRAETERMGVEASAAQNATQAAQTQVAQPSQPAAPLAPPLQIVVPGTEGAAQASAALVAAVADMRLQLEQSQQRFAGMLAQILTASTAPKQINFVEDGAGQTTGAIVTTLGA